MSTSSQSNQSTYFNIITTGVGYLNRIRVVNPKKGDSFLACEISALNGPGDKPEYRRFDLKVVGKDAEHLIRRCEEAVKDERKVLVGFCIGDMWTDTFTYSKGKHQGETGVSLKARLLRLSCIKIDGKLVYKEEPKDTKAAVPADTKSKHVPKASQENSSLAPQTASAPLPEIPSEDFDMDSVSNPPHVNSDAPSSIQSF